MSAKLLVKPLRSRGVAVVAAVVACLGASSRSRLFRISHRIISFCEGDAKPVIDFGVVKELANRLQSKYHITPTTVGKWGYAPNKSKLEEPIQ